MSRNAVMILVMVVSAAGLWLVLGRNVKAVPLNVVPEPVVLQGEGIRYDPHPMPIDLGGGLKEWGRTPEGQPVIARNDPATYNITEWW